MKIGPIIAAVVVIAALAFGAMSFKSSLVAYVPFKQAVDAASTGSTVQIMGVPVPHQTQFDKSTDKLDFVLKERTTGQLMPVVFKSPKPDNFDEAVSIAAIGHYDPTAKTFIADNLMVKCPSKYAGDPSATTNRNYGSQS